MVITYELLKKLEKLEYFNNLLTSGIIPLNWIDYKMIFEFYTKELLKLSAGEITTARMKRQAKTNTAEEFSIGESSVYQIIKKMTS